MTKFILAAGFMVALLVLQTPARAQDHTFVSGVGDDINPCSRSMACRTFAGAIGKTAAGGTISVLDSAGYGSVIISKSISIVADGAQAMVLSGGGGAGINSAIRIAAGANDEVHLRGLLIQSSPSGSNGIEITTAGAVHISHCLIRGHQSGSGIILSSATKTRVFVEDCDIALNQNGIVVTQGESEIVLDHVRLLRNQTGILSKNNLTIFHVADSVMAYNGVAVGQVGGRILSTRTNALVGNDDDGQGMGQETLK